MTELPRIVRERLRAQASGRVEAHPDADLLTAFCERTLTQNERQQVMAHLALCADCREAVALAVPPHVAESAPIRPMRPARRLRWVHWFALAASVVVVAAAVLQLPHGNRQGSEIQSATREGAPVATTKPEAKPESEKLADKVTTVNGPAAAPPKQQRAEAERDDFRELAKTSAAGQPPKPDDAAAQPGLYDKVEANKRQARGPSRPGTVSGRAGGIGTGSGAGLGPGIVGGVRTGAFDAGKQGAVTSPARERRNAPQAPPPPAARQSNEAAAPQGVEENRRAKVAEKVESKDAEAGKPEAAAAGTREDGRQVAVGGAGQAAGQKEAAGQLANQQAVDADQKSRAAAAASQPEYQRPEKLPMKKHPAEKTTETSTLTSRLARKLKAPLRWTVSAAGMVRRSLDSGKSWQDVTIAEGVRFRAVAVQDGNVWAGGEGGALFHSSDSGESWSSRPLSGAAKRLEMTPAFDILRIDITASGQVTVTTSQRQTFVTTDQGKNWSQQ